MWSGYPSLAGRDSIGFATEVYRQERWLVLVGSWPKLVIAEVDEGSNVFLLR